MTNAMQYDAEGVDAEVSAIQRSAVEAEDGQHSGGRNEDDGVRGRVHVVRRADGATVNAEDLVYPAARKVRGRPKGSGKTLNRMYTNKGRKRVMASHDAADASQATNNCVECGLAIPPGTVCKRRKGMLDWVQCDVCDFWYHLCCTSLTVLPRTNKVFKCVRCS